MNLDRKAFVSCKKMNLKYTYINGMANSVSIKQNEEIKTAAKATIVNINDSGLKSRSIIPYLSKIKSPSISRIRNVIPKVMKTTISKKISMSLYKDDPSLNYKYFTRCILKRNSSVVIVRNNKSITNNKVNAISINNKIISKSVNVINTNTYLYSNEKYVLSAINVISQGITFVNSNTTNVCSTIVYNGKDSNNKCYSENMNGFTNKEVLHTHNGDEKFIRYDTFSVISYAPIYNKIEIKNEIRNDVMSYKKQINEISYIDVVKAVVIENIPKEEKIEFSYNVVTAQCYDKTGLDIPTNVDINGKGIDKILLTTQKNNFFEFKIEGIVQSVYGLPSGLVYENNYIKGIITQSGEYIIKVEFNDKSVVTYEITVPYYQRLL